ncbi:MAG TPA: class I SAM-dependent methyltransferase [Solirubrobacterales bacterium]|nr:class I SAM-dependent methyltransferase [Solirubrobacterales bacterium]
MAEQPPHGQFHWDPGTYLEMIRGEVPRFDELQAASIDAIPAEPQRVLELGVGTGETSRRLLDAHPGAEIIGLDSSPEMLFRARSLGIETRLARMEDPLPDGPWDLVIAVLSVHHLRTEQKRDLFRRIQDQSRALVIGDVVEVPDGDRTTPIDPEFDHPEPAERLAELCGGELSWRADDLAVVVASYA